MSHRTHLTPNGLQLGEVVKIFFYDMQGKPTGKFTVIDREDLGKVRKYKWRLSHRYAITTTKKERKRLSLHRLLMGCMSDHIDGDGLNNRRSNLRPCTHQQNMHNQKLAKHNTSGYKGVVWCGYKKSKRWRAEIKLGGRKHYLGYYENVIDAALAYDKAARELHGEFAYQNFPQRKKLRRKP